MLLALLILECSTHDLFKNESTHIAGEVLVRTVSGQHLYEDEIHCPDQSFDGYISSRLIDRSLCPQQLERQRRDIAVTVKSQLIIN